MWFASILFKLNQSIHQIHGWFSVQLRQWAWVMRECYKNVKYVWWCSVWHSIVARRCHFTIHCPPVTAVLLLYWGWLPECDPSSYRHNGRQPAATNTTPVCNGCDHQQVGAGHSVCHPILTLFSLNLYLTMDHGEPWICFGIIEQTGHNLMIWAVSIFKD